MNNDEIQRTDVRSLSYEDEIIRKARINVKNKFYYLSDDQISELDILKEAIRLVREDFKPNLYALEESTKEACRGVAKAERERILKLVENSRGWVGQQPKEKLIREISTEAKT